jgi:hypothetical protein
MKNSNNTIGNRSRDLPVCSAVPQPLRHRVPHQKIGIIRNIKREVSLILVLTSFTYFVLVNFAYNKLLRLTLFVT